MEPYSDWSSLTRSQQESKIKDIAREILGVISRQDMPTKILAHPDDIEGIKADLMNVRLGSEEADAQYQFILSKIEWIGEGNTVKMYTVNTEEEIKIETQIAHYLNDWVESVGLAKIAAQEQVPLVLLQHKDILLQIWCSWMAQKLKNNNSNIIVPGGMF